jgi:two-component system, NtrC family, response regulator HydG
VKHVIVIDDEPAMGENISRLLKTAGIDTGVFTDPEKGLAAVLTRSPDAVLLDVRMAVMSGEEVFARLHEGVPEVPVIFLTAYGSIEGAVLAMRSGAFDYLRKPFNREELLLAVERAVAHRRMGREVEELRGRLTALGEDDLLESRSPVMQAEARRARKVASTDATVLILGESGTGKEVMARWIHELSPRRPGPFVPIDCTALPPSLVESELFGHEKGAFTGAAGFKKGLIECSQGGTLFFDEVGDLPAEVQTRLFRFVEDRRVRRVGGIENIAVDCRILCATNQDLAEKIRAGTFREELFYRLAVVTIRLPALRERPEDIPALARLFLQRFGRSYDREITVPSAFFEQLLHRPWHGNIRELKNCIERFVALGGSSPAASELVPGKPPDGGARSDLHGLSWREARKQYLARFEQTYARSLLARNNGNVSAAARDAGVDRKTLYAMLRRLPDPQPEE